MTIEQLARELRAVPAADVDEWIDLRSAAIASLSDDDRRGLIMAIDGLKAWLRTLSFLVSDKP